MLKGRDVTFYRWGTVIQAAAFLSSFLKMDICIFVQNICALKFTRFFRSLYIMQHPFRTVSLFSLILHCPQENISRQTFEHRAMLCDHGLKCTGPVTDGDYQTGWIISRCSARLLLYTVFMWCFVKFLPCLIIAPEQTFCLKGWFLFPYLWAFLTGWTKRVKS